MKAIMISIKPKWVTKILNGEKTIEIRKTCPEIFKYLKPYEGCSIDVYIYCTKDNKHKLEYCDIDEGCWSANDGGDYYNGKVVAKFKLNKVERIRPIALGSFLTTPTLGNKEILDKCCLTENEIRRYLTDMYGYAWYISNLEIFDRPKELNEFKTRHYPQFAGMVRNKTHYELKPLTKAPQSFAYIEVEDKQ